MMDFLQAGGVVLGAIFALSLLAWFVLLDAGWQCRRLRSEIRRAREVQSQDPAWLQHTRWQAESLGNRLRLPANAIVLLPLLGLLGTVLGMIDTFHALSETSKSEAREMMASGISQALITTQAGLLAAISVMVIHGNLRSRVQSLLLRLAALTRHASSEEAA